MANCKNHGKKKAVFLANTALIFPYGRGREILCRGAMRLKGGVCKGLHPSARVKKSETSFRAFFLRPQALTRCKRLFGPLRLIPRTEPCLPQNFTCKKPNLPQGFFVKPVLYSASFGRFSVGGNGLFSAEAPPKPLGAPLLFLSVFYACQRASPSAAQPLPHFFALSLSVLFLTRSPYFLFFSPALPRRRRGRAVRARRRIFSRPAVGGAGKENLQEKGGVNRRAVKILKTRGGTFAFAKKKVVFSPKGRPTRGNAGKCRKNLFFG